MRKHFVYLFALILCMALPATLSATIYGRIGGIVHDPQHRPVQGAMVMLHSTSSDWSKTANTDANGEFQFNAVPLGKYTVSVASPGFEQTVQTVLVESGSQPVLHYQLALASEKQTVNVTSTAEVVPTDTATPITVIDRRAIMPACPAGLTGLASVRLDTQTDMMTGKEPDGGVH